MPRLAIVVPVYNGLADLERCLSSLARHRPADSELIFVDDGSTEARILPRLREFAAAHPAVRVIDSERNLGFIASANRGAAEAPEDADLLFLNTDTEVTDGWADALRNALRSHAAADVCCPLSNNATILSVPGFQQENDLPPEWSADQMASLVRTCAARLQPVPIPTPVGFCMLVRRDAWRRFGPFDPAFGRGYGEEDDFGQKVQAAGRLVLCEPRAFVYHKGAASFGQSTELGDQRRANWNLLLSRWPDYAEKTRAWCRANPLRPLHESIWEALIRADGLGAFHVLHVLRHWQLEGPVRAHMMSLVEATRGIAIHTVVAPTPDRGAWMDAIDFEAEQGLRVTGLIDLEERLPAFVDASPAQLVHFHGDWAPGPVVEAVRRQRAALVTPEQPDPARTRELYREIGQQKGPPVAGPQS